ncbi:uncharacterized protein LOC112575060 isoform X2 [Pomacea canaliculata]|uniref:uncharacterized protein LOC112575060 isoform X2 n=1 Tax=Pomacea canaliculata TaxID=400727 RepID=UPI000D73241E|nr:uncharacterized protein LOC112575060 isoform X2 [Pomacea canaliculata]
MNTSQLATVKAYMADGDILSLIKGSPGLETLKDCKDILLKATNAVLDENADVTGTFTYGPEIGDAEFRDELAMFLTQEYGDEVKSSHLMVTAGASQALHMITTVMFSKDSIVFVEEPTYFAASMMLSVDLQMKVIPVPCDADGINVEELDHLLTKYRPAHQRPTESKRPFWAFVYTVPVYNNPTGRCYSPSRCRSLVEVARKHEILLVAEDVYNLIHFGEDPFPPPRLLSYDCPADPDYKGHVLSIGTFSKILAPSLRLGWVEAPECILLHLNNSNLVWSGGSLNHYASKLAAAAMHLGLLPPHVHFLRQVYKSRCDAVCQILRDGLPDVVTFTQPQRAWTHLRC